MILFYYVQHYILAISIVNISVPCMHYYYAQYFGCVQLKRPVEKGMCFYVAQKGQRSRVFVSLRMNLHNCKGICLNALLSNKITFLTFDIFGLLKTHPFLHWAPQLQHRNPIWRTLMNYPFPLYKHPCAHILYTDMHIHAHRHTNIIIIHKVHDKLSGFPFTTPQLRLMIPVSTQWPIVIHIKPPRVHLCMQQDMCRTVSVYTIAEALKSLSQAG